MTGKPRPRRPEASPEAVERATGKLPEEWYSILDSAGAQRLTHKEIATMLGAEHDVSGWWSQHLTVEYERARGMRAMYETTRGFQVSASKTMAAPVSRVYEAFANGELRERWLPGAPLTVRKDTPLKSTRAVWDDGARVATTASTITSAARIAARSQCNTPSCQTRQRWRPTGSTGRRLLSASTTC